MFSNKKTTKLMIAISSILIIILIFVTFKGFSIIRKSTVKSSQDFLMQSAQYAGKVIKLSLKNKKTSLNYLVSNNFSEQELISTETIDDQKEDSTLKVFFNSLENEAEYLFYIDLNGQPQKAIHWDQTSHSYSILSPNLAYTFLESDDYVNTVLKRPQSNNGYAYFIDDKAMINLYETKLDNNGQPMGIFVLPIKLSNFYQNFMKDFQLEFKGYPMIKDKDMRILMHPVEQQVGLGIVDDRQDLFPDLDFSDLQKLADYQLSHESGQLTYKSYWWDESPPRQTLKISSFEWIHLGPTKWVVAVNADYQERADDLIEYIIILACLILIFIFIFVLFNIISFIIRNKEKIERENQELIKQQEIQNLRHRLEIDLYQNNKMETVGLLATSIMHDMNNFLTPIIGNTELLISEHQEDPVLVSDLEEIMHSAKKGQSLSTNLLRFSHVTEQTTATELDISQSVAKATQIITGIASDKIDFSVTIDAKVGKAVYEEVDLQNILYNFISNAIQATQALNKQSHIQVSLSKIKGKDIHLVSMEKQHYRKEKDYACLQVKDNGTGMPAHIQQDILKPFFTTKPAGEGTGLGLFVVNSIVSKYDWLLDFTTDSNGTSFFIYIPITKP